MTPRKTTIALAIAAASAGASADSMLKIAGSQDEIFQQEIR